MPRKSWKIDKLGRECRICTEYKTWDNYYRDSNRSTGYSNRCKDCKAELNRLKRAQWRKEGYSHYQRTRDRRPEVIVKENIRNRTRQWLKRGISTKKHYSSSRLIGCTAKKLAEYISEQWEPGMNWNNYGQGPGTWNIDHIHPLSKVDMNCDSSIRKYSHYSNLRPMWSVDNFKKSNKLEK